LFATATAAPVGGADIATPSHDFEDTVLLDARAATKGRTTAGKPTTTSRSGQSSTHDLLSLLDTYRGIQDFTMIKPVAADTNTVTGTTATKYLPKKVTFTHGTFRPDTILKNKLPTITPQQYNVIEEQVLATNHRASAMWKYPIERERQLESSYWVPQGSGGRG
jgi:hypothetical protein